MGSHVSPSHTTGTSLKLEPDGKHIVTGRVARSGDTPGRKPVFTQEFNDAAQAWSEVLALATLAPATVRSAYESPPSASRSPLHADADALVLAAPPVTPVRCGSALARASQQQIQQYAGQFA